MKTLCPAPLLVALLMPHFAKASELHNEFVTRCLAPMIDANSFGTEDLIGPFREPSAGIEVAKAAVQRQSWQFPDQDWVFGTISVGRKSSPTVRACGITISDFQGSQNAVVVEVMNSIGQSAEVCQFALSDSDMFGFRSVVHNTRRSTPILVNFSPVNDGSYVLMAWEVPPEAAGSPCSR